MRKQVLVAEAGGRSGLDEAVYYGLAVVFHAVPRALYEISVSAVEPVMLPPGTLIVTNHKRDLDSVIHPAALYWRQPRPRRPLWFAGREDMFIRGFLAGYAGFPRWVRRWLYATDLTRVMRMLRVLPIRRFPERTMAEALREALAAFGDLPLRDILAAADAAPVPRSGPEGFLSDALGWPQYDRWRGPVRMRSFREPYRSRLASRQRAVVAAQVSRLARLLDEGGVLYMAPEGAVSVDGRLRAFRSALRQVLERATGPVRIRPSCITYDFMRPGRLRVVIAIGRLVEAGDPVQAAEAVRRSLGALHVMTATQVCSYALWQHASARRPAALTRDGLVELTAALSRRLAACGVSVDARLCGDDLQPHVGRWLRAAARRGIVVEHGPRLEVRADALARRPVGHRWNPVRYAVNELVSVCELLGVPLNGAVPAEGTGPQPPPVLR